MNSERESTPENEEETYERHTKHRYKSDQKSASYHSLTTGSVRDVGLRGAVRGRTVTWAERRGVRAFLTRVPNERVLDIPSGTGKLAPVFHTVGCSVVAADISREMLTIGRQEFRKAGHNDVEFVICDAEDVSSVLDDDFAVTVCLRLFHRVPDSVVRSILAEFSSLSPYAIISMAAHREGVVARIGDGVKSPMGGSTSRNIRSVDECTALLEQEFNVLAMRRILPAVSNELLFLVRSKTASEYGSD